MDIKFEDVKNYSDKIDKYFERKEIIIKKLNLERSKIYSDLEKEENRRKNKNTELIAKLEKEYKNHFKKENKYIRFLSNIFNKLFNDKLNKLSKIYKYNEDVLKEILKWETVSFSPCFNSISIYNSNDISWGYKPEGSLRISDHWNWNLGRHCPLKKIKNGDTINKLMLAKFVDGKYEIIKEF